MRKFMVAAIPVAALVLFVCIMISGSFFKKPFGKNDDVAQMIETIMEDVNNEAWDEAVAEVDELDSAWRKVIKRIQFSEERDEINFLTSNVARLRGAVSAKDKSDALMELNDAYSHWKELGK
ncbi:MAG TPA: DUF4363 family protein [Clostridiales bacterium]|nr:DUF4363 family protein [Clostridiales bacterium]